MLLYIDPGTGSMLLSLFIGIATAATFGLRTLFIKLQFLLSGGKTEKNSMEKAMPYVIFSDHKRYWNVFKPICDEFEKREIPLVYYTCSADDPALTAEYKFITAEFIGEGNKAFSKLNSLNADILIATTPNLDVYQWKRSKNVKYYVHIPHTVDDLAVYRMFGLDYYDAVFTTGKNQNELIRKIESLRPAIKAKEIVTVGSLTLDNLKKRYDTVERYKTGEEPVILLAPSWGASSIFSRYGEKLLEALKKTEYRIIVRPHPQTIVSEKHILEPLVQKYPDFEWNYDNDNFDVLNKADLLITDFSGIIFDYTCVFNKPVIYADTSFNTLPYDADWLDEPIWAFRVLPEIGIQLKEDNFADIGNVIMNTLNSKSLQAGREKVKAECWENIGNSASTSVECLIEMRERLVAK